MKITENIPLPAVCERCTERKEAELYGISADAYCYNCDFALERFTVSFKGPDGEETTIPPN